MGDPGLMPFLWFKVALVAAFFVYAIHQIVVMRRDVAAAREAEQAQQSDNVAVDLTAKSEPAIEDPAAKRPVVDQVTTTAFPQDRAA